MSIIEVYINGVSTCFAYKLFSEVHNLGGVQ